MFSLNFVGPVRFSDKEALREIPSNINGVYLWCVKKEEGNFHVYYVGEARDVRKRMLTHLRCQLNGLYTGHDIEHLKRNELVIAHQARVGMTGAYKNLEPKVYNQELAEQLWVFYASIDDANIDKQLRCRYETGISNLLSDSGNCILFVGHLRHPISRSTQIVLKSSSSHINGLTGKVLSI